MTRVHFMLGLALVATPQLSGCVYQSHDKKLLTRAAFAAAVSKCRPLAATFTENAGGAPSVGITIPAGVSTVPDCMARQFDDYAIKELKITYDRGNG